MSVPAAIEGNPIQLLSAKAAAGATGILTARRGRHRRLICLEGGNVVFAASNLIEEQLDEELVRRGILTPSQLEEAKATAADAQKNLSAVLEESGVLDRATLLRAMEGHVRKLTMSTLDWTGGACRFEPGRPKLNGELTVRLSVVTLILEYARWYPPSLEQVRAAIGPPDMRPVVTAHAGRMVDGLVLSPEERSLLEGCDGSREISVILEQSEFSTDKMLRALHGMLLLSIVEPSKTEQASDEAHRAVGREETLARLHQAENADHYLVLGVESKASAAQIRDAYYYLARRFHPDRYRTGPLQDLQKNIEAYFTQVTEAYNTLSDPERRKRYDTDLASRMVKKEEPKQDTAYLARENFARAKLLLDKRRFQDAVTFLENAVNLDSSRAEYFLELGRVLIRNPRRRADAERFLRQASALDPTSALAFLALGELYRKTDRKEQAVRAFRHALQCDPQSAEAQQQLKELG